MSSNEHRVDPERLKAIVGMALALGETLGAERQLAYMHAVRELSNEELLEACDKAARTLEWFPKPGQLIALVRGTGKQLAERAWQALLETCRCVGRYSNIALDDPAAAYALRSIGGWCNFGSWDESETHWRRKEFVEAYVSYDGSPVELLQLGIGDNRGVPVVCSTDRSRKPALEAK